MKKWTATILSLLTLAAISAAPVTQARSAPLLEASAEVAQPFSAPTATPTHVATTEGFSAVADGQALYLFDEEKGGFWQKFTHGQAISQIAFDTQGTLYFKDALYDLYALNANTWTEEAPTYITDKCATFFLDGNDLYTNTFSIELHDAEGNTTKYALDGVYESFAFLDEKLYAVKSDNGLYELTLSATATATHLYDFTGKRQNLTAVNGNLFATDENGSLYGYSLSSGTETQTDTGSYTSLSARGNRLYAVKNKEIYTCATEATATPTKATGEFALPYIENIPTGSLKTDVEQGTGAFEVVTTKPQALLVEVDLANAGATLPVAKTVRQEALTALKIGETAGYALLAHRENVDSEYKTYLAANVGYTPLSKADYFTAYKEEASGYLTNAAALYKYPHLGLPALEKAERGAQITLLGEVRGLDCDYYQVRYGEVVGYIPKGYVNTYDGAPEALTEQTIGETSTNKDAVWRMAYILLGAAVIGILVDLLILRKKD